MPFVSLAANRVVSTRNCNKRLRKRREAVAWSFSCIVDVATVLQARLQRGTGRACHKLRRGTVQTRWEASRRQYLASAVLGARQNLSIVKLAAARIYFAARDPSACWAVSRIMAVQHIGISFFASTRCCGQVIPTLGLAESPDHLLMDCSCIVEDFLRQVMDVVI